MWHVLKSLELNVFQKKWEKSSTTKIWQQKSIKYKHMIRLLVVIFFIGFTDFLFSFVQGKGVLDYPNVFSPNESEKGVVEKIYCKDIKFKNPEITYSFNKTLFVSVICGTYGSNDNKIFKEWESIEILDIPGLLNEKQVKVSCTFKSMFNYKIC